MDTGIYAKGWTRDLVVEFMRESGAVDEPTIQSETDRYIWPAQALSYNLGQLKFRELHERARKELGPKFDIRSFHDEMLNGETRLSISWRRARINGSRNKKPSERESGVETWHRHVSRVRPSAILSNIA